MMNHNAYLKILKQEIEDYFVTSVGTSGDIEWHAENVRELHKRIQAVLVRRTPHRGQQELKPSISINVLKKIFRYDTFDIQEPIDGRMQKTLKKLCIFLGYEDWNDFIHEKNTIKGEKYAQNPDTILDVVRKACQAEFDAYKTLPKIQRTRLRKYWLAGESAYNLIDEILIAHQKKCWVLTNENNPSMFEIYDVRLEKLKGKEAYVKSDQQWFLKWFDTSTSSYTWFYNHKGEQDFKLVYIDGVWKIKSNFYSATRDGGSFGSIPPGETVSVVRGLK